MDTHNRRRQPLNSPLDELIRDQLTHEARHSEPQQSDRILMRLLQHAQTEVEQLPAMTAATEGKAPPTEQKTVNTQPSPNSRSSSVVCPINWKRIVSRWI
jgi:hypothetical protein